MPKQRHLLTALFLLLAALLAAQPEFALRTDASLLQNDEAEGYAFTSRLTWDHSLAQGFDIRLSSNLNLTDRLVPANIQKLWHHGEAGLSYASGQIRLQAGYRNLAFHGAEILTLYPAWHPGDYQKKLTQHQGSFAGEYDSNWLRAEAHAQAKNLRYTPYVFDFESLELLPQPARSGTDVYYGASIAVPVTAGLTAFVSADHKDGLFADDGTYRLTGLKGGLALERKLPGGINLSALLDLTNRAGDAIPDQRRNLLQTSLRLQSRVSNDLSAYLLVANNSCLNAAFNEAYLLSNQVRGHVQYSFTADPSGGSYLLAGGKYSPENKASAAFLEGDYRVFGGLYAGGGLSLQFDRQARYSGKLSYYFQPLKELHLQFTHLDNQILDQATDYLGLGSSIYW